MGVLFSENYRLQSKYENHLIGKVALFQFVNSFLSLFYIAFYLRDQDKLKEVLLSSYTVWKGCLTVSFSVATGWFAHIAPDYRESPRVRMAVPGGAMEAGQAEFQAVGSVESNAGIATPNDREQTGQ